MGALGGCTLGLVLCASVVTLAPATQPRATAPDTTIRPFKIQIPQSALADLRKRVAGTRWPDKETVTDVSQGVPLAPLQQLARYWATDYDWRKVKRA